MSGPRASQPLRHEQAGTPLKFEEPANHLGRVGCHVAPYRAATRAEFSSCRKAGLRPACREATCRPAPTLPTHPNPAVKFVKIDIAGEHQQSGGDEFVTLPDRASEPPASNDAGAFGPDVIAALSDLAKVVDERLKFGTLRGEECFAV